MLVLAAPGGDTRKDLDSSAIGIMAPQDAAGWALPQSLGGGGQVEHLKAQDRLRLLLACRSGTQG